MTLVGTYLILGLSAGGLYALIAAGLVTIHKGSGVVNIAQGAIAMFAAFAFGALQPGMGTQLGILLAIASAVGIGLATYTLVMRPLRHAPTLATLIASVAVLLVLQTGATLLFDINRAASPDAWPRQPYDVLGIQIAPVRVYVLVATAVLVVLLSLLLTRTRFGIYTQAAAESEKGVILLGRSPGRIAAMNWALGSAFSGVAGIFASSIVGLQLANLTLLVIPGLAAALFARFSSILLATAAALAIGVAQSFISGYWGQSGLRDLVPFVILVIVLLKGGEPIPPRGMVFAGTRAPAVTSARPTVGAGIVLTLAIVGLVNSSFVYQNAITISIISAIVALSLVVLTGYVGQISLAQLVIAGIGGFSASRFAVAWELPFPLPVILATITAGLFGLLVGLPSLRVRGHNLAVLTLAAGVVVQSAVFADIRLTGGSGGAVVPSPEIGSLSFDPFQHTVRFGLLCLCILLLCVFLVSRLRQSALGLRMLAVRDNERAATSLGWSTASTKLLAFTIASCLAGLGGALLGYQASSVVSYQFTTLGSLLFLGFAYVTGIGSVAGAILAGIAATGGVIVTAIQFAFPAGRAVDWVNFVLAVMVVLAVLLHPDGVMPAVDQLKRFLAKKLGRTAGRRRGGVAAPRSVPGTAMTAPESEGLEGDAVSTTNGPHHTSDVSRRQPRQKQSASPALSTEDLTVQFGAVKAVDGVSLDIRAGIVTGLIGPNGSGKTTLVDAVSGFVGSTGRVLLFGEDLSKLPAHLRARAGLVRTFQSLELFEELTVSENILTGLLAQSTKRSKVRLGGTVQARVAEEAAKLGLADVADLLPRQISTGQRRLTAMARALVADPQLVVFDEPASGLDVDERAILRTRLRALAEDGATVLLIEHDVELVFSVCDYVHVLDSGHVIASGVPSAIRKDPLVIAAYLGEEPVPTTEENSEAKSAL